MFNPSLCLHVVQNISPSISVTHNYVDATNVPPVLHAIARKISETLCILALEGCPERRKERACECYKVYLREVELLTDENVLEEAVEVASQGEAEVAAMLHEVLSTHMPAASEELGRQLASLQHLTL